MLLLISCASYPKKNGFTVREVRNIENLYFSDTSKDYVYKANIEAFGNSFGGIFIIKKLGDDHHRIAFTTELGNKIFDFSFQGEDFKVNHILKDMDKKILINVLKNDFQVLVAQNPFIEKSFQKDDDFIQQASLHHKTYYYFLTEEKLKKVVRVGNGKEKVVFLFSEINDNIAQQIRISHQNFKLNIALKAL